MADLWNLIQASLQDKLEIDDRPTNYLTTVFGYDIGIVAGSSPSFHIQLLLSIFLQIIILQAFSIAIWYGVIQQQSRTRALLFGLGFVIPAAFLFPICALNLWDVRNTTVRFGYILLPLLVPFKCFEALFGSHNKVAELNRSSLTAYRYYAGFPQLPLLGENGVLPLRVTEYLHASWELLFWFLVMTVVYSALEPFEFRPFPQQAFSSDSFLPTLDVGRMYNSFAQAVLFFSTLIFAMKATGILCMIVGLHSVDHYVFDRQPLFCSTSPRDFWGYRWNTLIHHHLKVGVYKPIRKHGGGMVLATLGTFLASGLIHEFISYIQFFRTDAQVIEDAPYYTPGAWGKHLVFFGWNGLLILLQDKVQEPMGRFTHSWPSWLKSHFVVLLSMPVGHCFMDDIVDGGYMRHLRHVVPVIIVKASQQG